jgi:hypothetical protein
MTAATTRPPSGPHTGGNMSERSKPPFRADQVGSLIRPDNVRQARKDFEAGKMSEMRCATFSAPQFPLSSNSRRTWASRQSRTASTTAAVGSATFS